MEQLRPFGKTPIGYTKEPYNGGTKFRNGDTLLARITPCLENGKTAQVNFLDNEEVGFGSTEYIVLRAKKGKADNDFVYYLSISPSFRGMAIKSMVGSSGRQRVQQSVLENAEFLLPDLTTQKKIASVLSSLDDKIELNEKINQNLEAQAQAIFKSWFVDFEPFKNGKFIDSELGKIPEGWRVEKLGNVTKNIRKKVATCTNIPVLSAVKEGRLVLSEEYFSKQVYSNNISKYILVNRDAYAYNPARINIGSLGRNVICEVGCVSPVYVVFEVEEKYERFFDLYFKGKTFKEEVKVRASGSVRQILSYEDFSLIKIIYPPKRLAVQFNTLFDNLYEKIKCNQKESRRLAQLRDTLLPKLISGEIDVSEVAV